MASLFRSGCKGMPLGVNFQAFFRKKSKDTFVTP
jgi:hypothetical protein